MKKNKTIEAFVLVHKRTGKIIEQAGISFNREDTEPDPMYAEEYGVKVVKIEQDEKI